MSGAILSGSEVELLCLKAARGAGLPWGLAEEAGFAARWLCRHGLDGPALTLGHLWWLQQRPFKATHPDRIGHYRAPVDRAFSALVLGAAVADTGTCPENLMGPVHAPALLLPFLAYLNTEPGQCTQLEWQDGTVQIGDRVLSGNLAELADVAVAEVTVLRRRDSVTGSAPSWPRTGAATLSALEALARRTTVPATAASRDNAGSATDDND